MEPITFRQALGRLIADLRAERKMTQEALAFEAELYRSHLGEIERGIGNPTIDTLDKIAKALGQTLGSLVIQAEDISIGKIAPRTNPAYINRSVSLPVGLTHDQLEMALNRTMVILNQIGINPDTGDIQANIYSGAVSNIVTKCIAEVSDFERNIETRHPDLYNPNLSVDHPDYGLEMKASKRPNKGGESHNPGHGWFMIIIYKVIDGQTHVVQVEVAQLENEDWVIHDRKEGSSRTRTAITKEHATQRLRESSVYLNPEHVPILRGGSNPL